MLREMKQLYIEGYGTKKIAKKFNLAVTTTRDYLLKAGVKFRKASKDKVPISQHNKFINLYQEGNSIKQIAQICNISFSTVQRHLHKGNVNLKKRGNPTLIKNQNYKKLTLEKAYILGVVGPGDGFIEYRKKEGIYRVALEATDLDFVEYFSLCLENIYNIKPKIVELKMRVGDSKPHYKSILQSKQVCEDILSYNANFKEKTWTVPEIIKSASEEIKAKYIQGFADSQGHVGNHPTQRAIILCNTNKEGLKEILTILNEFDIYDCNINKLGIVVTARRSIESFAKNINFNIQRKKESLLNLIDRYKQYKTPKRELEKLSPEIIDLRKKGLSYPKISESLGISTKTAWNYAKDVLTEESIIEVANNEKNM